MNTLYLCCEIQVLSFCRQILEEEARWERERENSARITVYKRPFALQAYSHHQCEMQLTKRQ